MFSFYITKSFHNISYLAMLVEPEDVGVKLHGFEEEDCRLMRGETIESDGIADMVEVEFFDKKSSLIAARLNGDRTT